MAPVLERYVAVGSDTGQRDSAREKLLRIPGYSHPVVSRGGQSSDAIALYEVMVTREYELTVELDSPAFIYALGLLSRAVPG
jgi:hypothetical protein